MSPVFSLLTDMEAPSEGQRHFTSSTLQVLWVQSELKSPKAPLCWGGGQGAGWWCTAVQLSKRNLPGLEDGPGYPSMTPVLSSEVRHSVLSLWPLVGLALKQPVQLGSRPHLPFLLVQKLVSYTGVHFLPFLNVVIY